MGEDQVRKRTEQRPVPTEVHQSAEGTELTDEILEAISGGPVVMGSSGVVLISSGMVDTTWAVWDPVYGRFITRRK